MKELAEKVAKKLGWTRHKGWDGTFYHPERHDSIRGDIDPRTIDEADFLSWPTVGLAIADARERGANPLYNGIYAKFWGKFGETNNYDCEKHGDIIAILLAYVEIPDEN